MLNMEKSEKQNTPRGSSRAAQNRKIRRDALREELKAREYIRQLTTIEQRLDPGNTDTYDREDVPMVKERVTILFRMLDKCLPNLRPVDQPVDVSFEKSLTNQGVAIMKGLAEGELTPSEATTMMQAVAAQARIVEVDELEKRVATLESENGT